MSDINASTGLYCIFGDPVAHSLSPAMHNAAFRAAGLDAVYLAFRPSSISSAIGAMRALPVLGASITIPYKTDVMALLDRVDPLATEIGAVNTLVNAAGTITGFNTDGLGVLEALRRAGAPPEGKRALILGNGGSARAISFTLISHGCAVTVAGRNPARYLPLVDDLKKKSAAVEHATIGGLTASSLENIDIIINTTSVGMAPDIGASPLPAGLITKRHTVFDIVYAPHETALLKEASAAGCRAVHGIDMLLFQGARQFELWTGKEAPVDEMRCALTARIPR